MQESFGKWRSDSPEISPGAHERRTSSRHVAVHWLARLTKDDGSELCVVHNICTTALIADVFVPCAVGEAVRVELGDTQQLTGVIVWASETNVEVRFSEPIELADLLERHQRAAKSPSSGPQPLEVSCQGWLECAGETFMVEVCDLSQGGARIAADVVPAIGQRVQLAIHGLETMVGKIRWREDGKLGLAFDELIPFETLTGWIEARDTQIGAHGQPRRWPRCSILLKTQARLGDVSDPVEMIVHNISRGGVLITCRRGLRHGDQVELALGPAGPVAGRVVWVGNGQAGVEFSRTIGAEHVLRPLGERSISPVLHHQVTERRPGLNSHRMQL